MIENVNEVCSIQNGAILAKVSNICLYYLTHFPAKDDGDSREVLWGSGGSMGGEEGFTIVQDKLRQDKNFTN